MQLFDKSSYEISLNIGNKSITLGIPAEKLVANFSNNLIRVNLIAGGSTAGGGTPINIGTNGEIAFTNASNDNLDYSDNFVRQNNQNTLIVKANENQTNSISSWQSSDDSTLAYISSNGSFGQGGSDVIRTTIEQTGAQQCTLLGDTQNTSLATQGLFNVFVGYRAGASTTTGSRNVFLGHRAGESNTTGFNNVYVGLEAGRDGTTARDNVFIGRGAGRANTTGTTNFFLGRSSGTNNTTGNNNLFLGNNTGVANVTGSNNVFIGLLAGSSNTTGGQNLFIGRLCGDANTTGSTNIFIGPNAGSENTTGSGNTFIGPNCGILNTTASNNLFIGNSAGRGNTTGTANTYIGFFSAFSNQTGSNNIYLGNNSGRNEVNTSNRLFIDNSSTSEPLIYGEFNNNFLRFNGSAEVKGNTNTTQFKIIGNANQTQPYTSVESSIGVIIKTIDSDGNMGVGVSSPTSRIDLSSNNGYDQLRLRDSYTPSGTSDTNGQLGDMARDDNYSYVKTSSGRKRSLLSTF